MAIAWKRRQLLLAAAQLGLTTAVGCGTVLHPERRGQRGGRLDWGVVVLDAVGLLFFFIPGVIAFAVDFSTGAIYLPPEGPPGTYPLAQGPLEKRTLATSSPSVVEVEQVVSNHAGQPVRLTAGKFVSEPLRDIGDFWATCTRSHAKAGAA